MAGRRAFQEPGQGACYLPPLILGVSTAGDARAARDRTWNIEPEDGWELGAGRGAVVAADDDTNSHLIRNRRTVQLRNAPLWVWQRASRGRGICNTGQACRVFSNNAHGGSAGKQVPNDQVGVGAVGGIGR